MFNQVKKSRGPAQQCLQNRTSGHVPLKRLHFLDAYTLHSEPIGFTKPGYRTFIRLWFTPMNWGSYGPTDHMQNSVNPVFRDQLRELHSNPATEIYRKQDLVTTRPLDAFEQELRNKLRLLSPLADIASLYDLMKRHSLEMTALSQIKDPSNGGTIDNSAEHGIYKRLIDIRRKVNVICDAALKQEDFLEERRSNELSVVAAQRKLHALKTKRIFFGASGQINESEGEEEMAAFELKSAIEKMGRW